MQLSSYKLKIQWDNRIKILKLWNIAFVNYSCKKRIGYLYDIQSYFNFIK